MTQTADHPTDEVHEVDLAISGMTCASCSARIERKLGKLDGVDAVVNLATEKATVRWSGPLTVEDLLRTVRTTGYGAEVVGGQAPPRPAPHAAPSGDVPAAPADGASPSTPVGDGAAHTGSPATAPPPEAEPASPGTPSPRPGPDAAAAAAPVAHHQVARRDDLLRRARFAAVLTVPVVALAMVPGLAFTGSAWVQLALAVPVVGWAALPFHRAAARAARHGASTMDTLVSLGVLAAFLWSLGVVLTGGSGAMGSGGHLYFETATVVTTFLLLGRWMEARATDRTRDALRGLLDLGAKDVAVLRTDPASGATSERRVPVGVPRRR